jgi:hypothetical protein
MLVTFHPVHRLLDLLVGVHVHDVALVLPQDAGSQLRAAVIEHGLTGVPRLAAKVFDGLENLPGFAHL